MDVNPYAPPASDDLHERRRLSTAPSPGSWTRHSVFGLMVVSGIFWGFLAGIQGLLLGAAAGIVVGALILARDQRLAAAHRPPRY